MEVGELGDEYDAPKEAGHDAQGGERDVRPEGQSETTGHDVEVNSFGLKGCLFQKFVLLCSLSNVNRTLFTSFEGVGVVVKIIADMGFIGDVKLYFFVL